MKILIVEDHEVVRAGVRGLIDALSDAETVIEAKSSDEAIHLYRHHRPDIVILDIRLGDRHRGLDVLSALLSIDDDVRVIIFSFFDDLGMVANALATGARAYVSKGAPADELLTAISRVRSGERYIEKRIAMEIAFSKEVNHPTNDLTPRETEILGLLSTGKGIGEIAASMGIAYKTVANSLGAIKQKLGVQSTADLIRLTLTQRNSDSAA